MRRKPRQAWTPERKQKAVDLYLTGLTIREVASIIGSNLTHVGRALHEAGVIRDKREMYVGSGNPAWKGGRFVDKRGYILIYKPDHPNANHAGYVREHRLIMEKKLRRYLLPGEVVHHKNGDVSDNRLSNLELFTSNGEHLAEELAGKVPKWSEDGRRRIKRARESQRRS